MDQVEDLSKTDKLYVQMCRMYLNVQTLADVSNAAGNMIIKEYMEGERIRQSKLKWPNQENPPRRAWKVWKRLLALFTTGGHNILKEEYKMGRWMKTHQEWEWLGCGNRVHNSASGLTLEADKNRRRPRGQLITAALAGRMMPSDVYLMRNGDTRFFLCWSSTTRGEL